MRYVMQIKKEFGEKEPTVKAESPKNDAVVELALKPIHWVLKQDVLSVDLVRNKPYRKLSM